ncbi:MAG: electron transfer flavoprotein, partial [Desulfobacterales bacterium]
MEPALLSPATYKFFHIPVALFAILIPLVGTAVFALIMKRRIDPMLKAAPDYRTDRIAARILKVLKIWLIQWRQPRYMVAGVLHIVIFAGFMILSVRSTTLVFQGFWEGFTFPGFGGAAGHVYAVLKDYAATAVLVACGVAAVRRGIFKPDRYAVPPRY